MQNNRPEKMQHSKEKEDTIQHDAMQLTTAIALPMALKAAMDLGILEIIQNAGPNARLSPSQIASHLVPCTNNLCRISDMTDRILRLLSSYSVVSCSVADHNNEGQVQRLYSLAPLSRYFLPSKDGLGSLASLFSMIHDKFMTDLWYHLKDAILEDQVPAVKAYGMSPKDWIEKNEGFAPIFSQAMKDFNALFIGEVLNEYKGFQGIKSLVDVGGGNGSILKAILSRYPTIKCINFDIPPIIEMQPFYPGIDHVAGDMLTSVPAGDAIFIKWVLKNIDDEGCLKVLKNCFKALPDGGKLMVVELVIPDSPDNSTSSQSVFQFDLYLTSMNAAGKERTAREFQALAKAAGFSGIQAMVRSYDMTLLEFHKIPSYN